MLLWSLVCLLAPAPEGLVAAGNVDSVLVWSLGDLAPGGSAREVLLLVPSPNADEVTARLDSARASARDPFDGSLGETVSSRRGWLDDGTTDFALEDAGYFRWGLERQALRGDAGGQLSQFSWWVHYAVDGERRRAGTPNVYEEPLRNLRVVEPLATSGGLLGATMETTDGALRIRVRARLEGDGAQVEMLVLAAGSGVSDLRLGIYANPEVQHDHDNDFARLSPACEGILVEDPATGRAIALAGLGKAASGWVGTWNSIPRLAEDTALPRGRWLELDDLDDGDRATIVAQRLQLAAPPGIYLPYQYRDPTTPETRTLTAEEARAVLERDWLFQAEGRPLAGRAREEVAWALSLANRLDATGPRSDRDRARAELGRLARRLNARDRSPIAEEEARALYFRVRELKRAIALGNPALDFASLLFIDQPQPRGPVNDIHEAIHRMGITAQPGGRLLRLDGLDPGGAVRQLSPEKAGAFWGIDVAFDGARVLFCRKPWDEKSFHLYEVGVDGTGLRQLTSSDYDDTDPIYLPDGHILFTSTRGNSYVRCGPFIYSYTLARCDADGGNVYLVSQNGEPDFVPSLLDDGRIVYSRWEYSDRPLWRIQSLWTVHPDGTNTRALWGNRSVWPDHLSEPRQIPGTSRVMFSGVGHHDWFSGSIGIVDPSKGGNFPDGLTKVTAERPWPECSAPPLDPIEAADYHSSGGFSGYKTPYPLSEEDFLVSARREDGRFRLYLMDVHGNRELIYEGAHNIWHAVPLRPRKVPPALPSSVQWPGTGPERRPLADGSLYSMGVYEGSGVPRGLAKYLRVMQLDHKTYSTWRKTWRHSGPAVSTIQEEGIKRVLSIVPVEEDGSANFAVPSGRAVYFQLLDGDMRLIQTMRSFAGVMPGERRGCVGCHESHSTAPVTGSAKAVEHPPTPLSPPSWGTESIGYARFAQAPLERTCGACHLGEGKGRAAFDLTPRPAFDVFEEPYVTLVGDASWSVGAPNPRPGGWGMAGALPVESMDSTMNDPRALGPIEPCTSLSWTSPLVQRAASGAHHGAQMPAEDLARLMTWVDACCPFLGEPELRALGDPDFPGIELLPIRPRVATAPVVVRP